jgi:hypothetical protein
VRSARRTSRGNPQCPAVALRRGDRKPAQIFDWLVDPSRSPSQCAGRVHPGRRNPGRHELAVIEPSRDRSSKPSSPTPHPSANGVGATTDAQARGQSRTQLHPSRVTRTRRIRGNRICGFTAKKPTAYSVSCCVAVTFSVITPLPTIATVASLDHWSKQLSGDCVFASSDESISAAGNVTVWVLTIAREDTIYRLHLWRRRCLLASGVADGLGAKGNRRRGFARRFYRA